MRGMSQNAAAHAIAAQVASQHATKATLIATIDPSRARIYTPTL
jgi:hypothetical protein